MPVRASGIGAVFQPQTVAVTPRMLLAYAAGIGCRPEKYLDDNLPGGLAAPAPYCVSLEWLISGDPASRSALGVTPDERLKVVHASQDTQFHRPLMAGETVTVGGQILDVRATRAGALVTSSLTVVGENPADQITTSLIGSLYRGVATDAPSAPPPARPVEADSPVAEAGTKIPISPEFTHVYSECAAIWNPIHTERRVALAAGLPDIIVHGTALWALAWRTLEATHGPLTRLAGRFSAMVVPGRPVTLLTGRLDPISRSLDFKLANAHGRIAISAGRAEFA